MHLLESYISLFDATGMEVYRQKAQQIACFFSDKLFIGSMKAVPENHSASWGCLDRDHSWFEPGHHFEWAWLLRQLTRTGGDDFEQLNIELKSRAIEEGLDKENLVIERVDLGSNIKLTSRRLWGTCEYIKTCASEVERALADGDECALNFWTAKLIVAIDSLRRRFLETEVIGLWTDRIDTCGFSLSSDVPASSLYHLAFSIFECERVLKRYVGLHSKFWQGRRQALFLDRDGVINVDTRYPSKPEQILFQEEVVDLIRIANEAGLVCVVVSNQSGVARGYFSESDVFHLHHWMNEELKLRGANIEAWYYCPYHHQSDSSLYQSASHYDRKPNGGMILRAAFELNLDLSQSFLIGDQKTDIEAAEKSGVKKSFLLSEIDELGDAIRLSNISRS